MKDSYTISPHTGNGTTNGTQLKDMVANGNTKSAEGMVSIGIKNDETDLESVEIMVKTKKNSVVSPEKEGGKPVSFLQMFRYADGLDRFLLITGTLAAMLNGLTIPANFLVYGQVATGFIYYTTLQSVNMSSNASMSLSFDPSEYSDLFGRTRGFALYFCIIGLSSILLATCQYTCWGMAAERQMRKIKITFFRSVLQQDIGWFDVHDAGELSATFNESISNLATGIGRETAIFFQWISTCVGAYTVALIWGWKLALACIAFSPLVIIIGSVTIRFIKNLSTREAKAYSGAGSVAQDALISIKTVMAFNGQEKECHRYNDNLGNASNPASLKGLAMGVGMGMLFLVMQSMFAFAFWYANKLMASQEPGFEPGSTLTILLGVMIGSMSLGQAFPVLETIAVGRAAAGRLYGVIDQEPEIHVDSEEGEKPATMEGRVEFRNVSFFYPARPGIQVLKDFSFQVKKGQTVALVGSSGSGKSTVIQLIERFYDASQGQVLLDGRNVKELNVPWLREHIGLVSQEPVLFGTTISENIRYGRQDVTEEDIQQAAIKANAHSFISALPQGYETLVGDRGTQMSGGQKQRIAIARALVRDPKILLLDEATSALDSESEAVVQKALETAQEGRTTVVIAHRLSTIQKADQIIAMQDGNFMEQGTHSELMKKNGVYHQLVEHQMQTDTSEAVVEELEHEILEVNEDSHDEKSPLAVRHKLADKSFSGLAQDEEKESPELPEFSMKRILRLNAPEWYLVVLGCFFSIICGVAQPVFAYLLSEFLRVFTLPSEESSSLVLTMMGITVAIGVGNAVIRIGKSICFAKAGTNLTRRLRNLTFEALMRQDMSFFDDPKNSVGILTTRLSQDATIVNGATGSKIGNSLESVATIVGALVVSILATWKLSLVILAFMPLMAGMGIVQSRLVVGFSKSNKKSVERSGQIVNEAVENIRLVQSLSGENTVHGKYSSLINEICRQARKPVVLTAVLLSVTLSIMFFAYAAAFTYGAYLVMYEDLAFIFVFRAFSAIIFGGMSVGRTSADVPDFAKAKMATRRLFGLIDSKPSIDVASTDGKVPDKFKGHIQFSGVSFQYPARREVQVLNDLGFTVQPGQTVALVGVSGCGKSTTLALLERFYDATSGNVMIDEENVQSLNLKWLRSHIGFVSQEPVLFDCSVAENIAYGDNSRVVPMDEIMTAARSANIHSFITSLPEGYDTNVGSKGTQLSGGQKQRVAIARALISNPKILLLDEATSALDSQSEKIVQQALDQAREGRTCLVIAHRLSTIQHADKIVIIHKGEMVESGSHSELLSRKGIYFRLIQAQNRHHKH